MKCICDGTHRDIPILLGVTSVAPAEIVSELHAIHIRRHLRCTFRRSPPLLNSAPFRSDEECARCRTHRHAKGTHVLPSVCQRVRSVEMIVQNADYSIIAAISRSSFHFIKLPAKHGRISGAKIKSTNSCECMQPV